MAATAANLHFDRRERHRIAAPRGRSGHGMRPGPTRRDRSETLERRFR